ncbi:MAG: hypothetical protein IT368_01785, partial [Candidatus Hydrogenedentes bacterium]|nr:hypothetical protein [Candidatus Hydrogenedentota bacterium]
MGRSLPLLLLAISCAAYADDPTGRLPMTVDAFPQAVHKPYTVDQGLPSNTVLTIQVSSGGTLVTMTDGGAAGFANGRWAPLNNELVPEKDALTEDEMMALRTVAGATVKVRDVARRGSEVAVAADLGLFVSQAGAWHLALPQDGPERWAPVDVRAVAYDGEGRLWFAAPQGVGRRLTGETWDLYTGANGLPFNDFTCMAAGGDSVWFGTTNGAIQFRNGQFSFRQGRRWLLDNEVRDIAVDSEGDAWIATAQGVSCITDQRMTLAEKAQFFEDEIERYHRRTEFGYVNPARLASPGDKSTATPVYTDNDGHFTGLSLGAVSLGYAATGREKLKEDAQRAFSALAFLSAVTRGGTHPAPEGFIA